MASIHAQEPASGTNRGPISGWLHWYSKRKQRLKARKLSQARFRLTREGLHLVFIVTFIFAGAVLRDIGLLILIAAAMIGLLLLQWRFNISTLGRLTVTRRITGRINQGVTTSGQITIENQKRWLPAWLVVAEDHVQLIRPNGLRIASTAQSMIDEIPPGSTSNCSYKLTFEQRGLYQVGPCTISTRFPMGLGKGWRTIDRVDEVVVHPKQGQLLPSVKRLLQNASDGHCHSTSHVGAHEADFYGLRPWASGDSRRWIHWRTTARLGELSVRQFDRLEQMQVCVLLDLYHSKPGQNDAQTQACEKAISFVATLVSQTAVLQRNRLAIAIAADTHFTLAGVQSAVLANNVLDQLAVATPSSSPEITKALAKMTVPLLANPHLIVVSSRPEAVQSIQQAFSGLLGKKATSRLDVKWLDVTQGDLEPYFSWTSNASKD